VVAVDMGYENHSRFQEHFVNLGLRTEVVANLAVGPLR
jgi:hypothetical protein